jgi:hypothetical protein
MRRAVLSAGLLLALLPVPLRADALADVRSGLDQSGGSTTRWTVTPL